MLEVGLLKKAISFEPFGYSTGNGVKHQKIPITTILSEKASKLASGPQHGFLKKLSRKNLWVQMGQTTLEQT